MLDRRKPAPCSALCQPRRNYVAGILETYKTMTAVVRPGNKTIARPSVRRRRHRSPERPIGPQRTEWLFVLFESIHPEWVGCSCSHSTGREAISPRFRRRTSSPSTRMLWLRCRPHLLHPRATEREVRHCATRRRKIRRTGLIQATRY